jgi:nitrite reductase/ring-hydroxylating ferredoxin subunit
MGQTGEPHYEKPRLHRLAAATGELEALDAPAKRLAKVVRSALPGGPVKDVLSGTFLGHPLHPLLTDLPIGSWTSALMLDWVGGPDSRTGARRLIAAGILAAIPTAAAGSSDWADTEVSSPTVRRTGIVHAAANVTALGFFTASYLARRRGRGGRALALTGAGALAAGGHLGGHLSFAEGVGVNQTAFEDGPGDWTPTLTEHELAAGRPVCARAGDVNVLIVRDGDGIHALDDRCTHRGGPLHEGEVADGCVTCPWHGSRFRLTDGSVERGPASSPQPLYETRVSDGRVEVRRAGRA